MTIRRLVPGFIATWTALALVLACTALTLAQDPKSKVPEPEDLTLDTKDGVALRCTYYPGTAKKASVPVILIHGWEGQRGEFDGLALYLQSLGHTVIVPDLRGHGQSTVRKTSAGDNEPLDLSKFRLKDVEAMVYDLEACKKFLMNKNNEGECNIASLCVVGAEFGSILALNWATFDWNQVQLPAYQQGQDVRALVLLTPQQSHKGMTTRAALSHPVVRSKLSTMLVAGTQDVKGSAEAKRLYKSFQTYRPKLADEEDDDKRRAKLDLFLVEPETSLTGTKLLDNSVKIGTGNVFTYVANFINLRLSAKQAEMPWTERKNPLRSE